MTQYIITEGELEYISANSMCDMQLYIDIRSNPYNPQAERERLLELEKWLYEEGMKFEKICDSEENYINAASACARRAQCYYTIEKIKELREGKDGEP